MGSKVSFFGKKAESFSSPRFGSNQVYSLIRVIE